MPLRRRCDLFRHCLFCDSPYLLERLAPGFPHGARVAYDPARERLWTLCDACHRWTLSAREVRPQVIAVLDRLVRDEGRLLAQTAHVALYQADAVQVVRLGGAPAVEAAWWRYGRELQQRHERLHSRGARWSAYSLAAVARVGGTLGLAGLELDSARTESPVAAMMRLRFGSTAWQGRAECPFCRSVLRAVPFDTTWWLHPRIGEQGLEVWVPCTRCDPWTPENAYRLGSYDARVLLHRALAYQNVAGASERLVHEAALRIEHAGAAHRLVEEVGAARRSLWSLGKSGTLALEMALADAMEAELLQAEAKQLEAAWRAAAPLAQIVDEELAGP